MTAKEIAGRAAKQALVSPGALKLIGLLEQTELANQEVIEVLKHDHCSDGQVAPSLQLSRLGFVEKISSVDQAVFLLGHLEILRMVQVLALGDALAVPMPGYAVAANELWGHSVMVAAAAELLSNERSGSGRQSGHCFHGWTAS